MLAVFLVFMPIYGASRGDLFVALIGPAFVLFYLFLSYLNQRSLVAVFRRKNDG